MRLLQLAATGIGIRILCGGLPNLYILGTKARLLNRPTHGSFWVFRDKVVFAPKVLLRQTANLDFRGADASP